MCKKAFYSRVDLNELGVEANLHLKIHGSEQISQILNQLKNAIYIADIPTHKNRKAGPNDPAHWQVIKVFLLQDPPIMPLFTVT